jgi:hypothetical protein
VHLVNGRNWLLALACAALLGFLVLLNLTFLAVAMLATALLAAALRAFRGSPRSVRGWALAASGLVAAACLAVLWVIPLAHGPRVECRNISADGCEHAWRDDARLAPFFGLPITYARVIGASCETYTVAESIHLEALWGHLIRDTGRFCGIRGE